jgi:hypothetical protein
MARMPMIVKSSINENPESFRMILISKKTAMVQEQVLCHAPISKTRRR